MMASEEDSVARPEALGGGGGGGSRVDCFEPSLLSMGSEEADVWVRKRTREAGVRSFFRSLAFLFFIGRACL